MKGKLIQINNVDGESIGLWYTRNYSISSEMLLSWFRDYDDSEQYNEEGIDGFEEFVKKKGYEIQRVFIEEIEL